MSNFNPNEQQSKAFDAVVKAFKNAKKTGLIFYAKSDKIVAYTKQADKYIESDFESCFGTGCSQIENLSSLGCISDSGADDYPSYRNQVDEDLYS